MKISKIIKELQKIQKKHGDLPVTVFDPEKIDDGEWSAVEAFISIGVDKDDKAESVTFIDYETAQSLR